MYVRTFVLYVNELLSTQVGAYLHNDLRETQINNITTKNREANKQMMNGISHIKCH